MKKQTVDKPFDSVAFMRQARAELSAKMNAMGTEAFHEWLNNKEYSDPTLARLAAGCRRTRGDPRRGEDRR